MEEVLIKPLSVNDAWKGRRYRSDKYKSWSNALTYILPKLEMNLSGKMRLCIEYGFSSKGSDVDNPTKPFLDVLSKKYGFNDNQIYELILYKKIVKKGDEFIRFSFKNIN